MAGAWRSMVWVLCVGCVGYPVWLGEEDVAGAVDLEFEAFSVCFTAVEALQVGACGWGVPWRGQGVRWFVVWCLAGDFVV